jgi:hypothetical protein
LSLSLLLLAQLCGFPFLFLRDALRLREENRPVWPSRRFVPLPLEFFQGQRRGGSVACGARRGAS